MSQFRQPSASTTVSMGSARRWLGTGVWAVLDQGLFAVANFVLNVMLARWLVPADYGAFTLAYALFLLLGTMHTALITEPMLVFGPGRFRNQQPRYLTLVAQGHWILGAGTASLLLIAAAITPLFGSNRLAGALVAVGLAAPFVLYQWLARRACYVTLRPRMAALAGALYLVLVVAGTIVVFRSGLLSTSSALAIMAAASAASASALWLGYSRRWRATHDSSMTGRPPAGAATRSQLTRNEAWMEHWRYGRWSFGAVMLGWFSGDVFYVALAPLHGLEASGALRAGMNLVMPGLLGFTALATVALPALVAMRREGSFRRALVAIMAVFVALGVLYAAILVLAAKPLVVALYGTQFEDLHRHVRILALLVPLTATASVMKSALRALERPRAVFTSYIFSAAVVVTAGMAAAWWGGVAGAATGMLAGSITAATVLAALTWRRRGEMARVEPS